MLMNYAGITNALAVATVAAVAGILRSWKKSRLTVVRDINKISENSMQVNIM